MEIPKWMEIAEGEMGQKEVAGSKANPRILEYHSTTSLKATSDEVPWCSAFVNWCMKEAGEERTNKANARSWLKYGSFLNTPRYGCIVVLRRGKDPAAGHVGFYITDLGDRIKVLGGNQGDQVKYSNYRKEDVIGYRWP